MCFALNIIAQGHDGDNVLIQNHGHRSGDCCLPKLFFQTMRPTVRIISRWLPRMVTSLTPTNKHGEACKIPGPTSGYQHVRSAQFKSLLQHKRACRTPQNKLKGAAAPDGRHLRISNTSLRNGTLSTILHRLCHCCWSSHVPGLKMSQVTAPNHYIQRRMGTGQFPRALVHHVFGHES